MSDAERSAAAREERPRPLWNVISIAVPLMVLAVGIAQVSGMQFGAGDYGGRLGSAVLLILGLGVGSAVNLMIDSAQPKIVENNQGLLVDFKLLGSAVNDSAVSPSLTVPIGTLDSMKIATASWEMIPTLSGRIIEFKASFSHASELGGVLTSQIKEVKTNYLLHGVKVNLPGRDTRLDFLAYSTDLSNNPDRLPQAIFESEIPGNTGKVQDAQSPVTVVPVTSLPNRPTSSSPEVLMSCHMCPFCRCAKNGNW